MPSLTNNTFKFDIEFALGPTRFAIAILLVMSLGVGLGRFFNKNMISTFHG